MRHLGLVRAAAAVLLAFALAGSAAQARSPEIYTGILSSTAVGGYDPVAYFKDRKPVAGKSDITWTGKKTSRAISPKRTRTGRRCSTSRL